MTPAMNMFDDKLSKMVVRLYDWMHCHRRVGVVSLVLSTLVLVALVLRIDYQEDISAFLPLDDEQQQVLADYQQQAGAGHVFALFQSRDTTQTLPPDSLQAAVTTFVDLLETADTAQVVSDIVTPDDVGRLSEMMGVLYQRLPALLTPSDYQRMDSLLALPDYVTQQLEHDKQLLMLPSAGMLTASVQHDPLNLFSPVLARQQPRQLSFVMVESPYGASETEHNGRLVDLLQGMCDNVQQRHATVSVHLTGGPVIAVGNARQIKTDSIVSVSVAVTLILLLLFLAFRNVRSLLLIAVSIGWGWLFALGCLSLVHREVSIIVIGISSVIVGIAVNYPLHLIAHRSHTTDMRSAIREIVQPLVVGNITTVGAFLTLLPLESAALRDLGLFAAFLLVGTIVFVLLWLPHMVSNTVTTHQATVTTHQATATEHRATVFDRLAAVRLDRKPWLVALVAVLTIPLAYYSTQTSFDTDLTHLNYMTPAQQRDMLAVNGMVSGLPADTASSAALARWSEWCASHRVSLLPQLDSAAQAAGFAPDSFDAFTMLLTTPPAAADRSVFARLTDQLLTTLTDDFNYIGWACGLIVFFFLWFSMGSFQLAILSFLPMAVSWLWILGLMPLLGIQFNIVNIILATFIFGQGDDYTIFMTEGCKYEYEHGRPMLAHYRSSIILSALIMFIGIGSLVIARHPALHSLGEVTVVGMCCVVLMAWIIPPLMFRLLMKFNNRIMTRS